MEILSDKILNKAFEIGFNYEKLSYREKATVSLPCSVFLKNGEFYQNTILILDEDPKIENGYIVLNIQDVERIQNSEYSLSHEFRKKSLETPEFRNDWPFFLRTKENKILGYNAYQPINFTFKKEIKASEIIAIVNFEAAKKEGFEFVNNNLEKLAVIYCGYDEKLIEKIKTNA